MNKDVAIIMGSDSDWPVMEAAAQILDQCGITYEASVVSAHRTPEEMMTFAKGAASAGFKVVIAGAGGAAHLPGMVAAATTLPVIGVPVPLKYLEGMDSLLGIGNAKNAGLLAARIIGSFDSNVSARVAELMEGARHESLSKHVPKL